MAVGRSRHRVGRGYTGDIPADMREVLARAWTQGIACQSNFAREHACTIALAASVGWISNVTLDGKAYTRGWLITAQGTLAYEQEENHEDQTAH